MTKLEVKVKGIPKPEIKWLKQGVEIIPSEEYQIENFEDGTSILVINEVYPDDTGEITFEAHNALGVAFTTTELVVEEGRLLLYFDNGYQLIFILEFYDQNQKPTFRFFNKKRLYFQVLCLYYNV